MGLLKLIDLQYEVVSKLRKAVVSLSGRVCALGLGRDLHSSLPRTHVINPYIYDLDISTSKIILLFYVRFVNTSIVQ